MSRLTTAGGELLVAADQRLHRFLDRDLGQPAHLGDQAAQTGNVFVECLNRMFCDHQPYLPVM